MRTAETHPTPQRVVDAIQVVAAWLREIEAAEAVISPQGGAAFHPTRKADELLAGWQSDVNMLEDKLFHYGIHMAGCNTHDGGVCNCGWADTLGDLIGRRRIV